MTTTASCGAVSYLLHLVKGVLHLLEARRIAGYVSFIISALPRVYAVKGLHLANDAQFLPVQRLKLCHGADILLHLVIDRQAAHIPVGLVAAAVKGNVEPERRILQEPLQDLALQHGAVGVDGDQQSHLPHSVIDLKEVLPDQRLTAGDAHALQDPLALFQEGQQLLRSHHRLRIRQKLRVVAEGAAEIAAVQEYGAGHFARKIKQSKLLKTLNIHIKTSKVIVSQKYYFVGKGENIVFSVKLRDLTTKDLEISKIGEIKLNFDLEFKLVEYSGVPFIET